METAQEEATRTLKQVRESKERMRSESRNQHNATVLRNHRIRQIAKSTIGQQQYNQTQEFYHFDNLENYRGPSPSYFDYNQLAQPSNHYAMQQYVYQGQYPEYTTSRYSPQSINRNRFAYDFSDPSINSLPNHDSFELSSDSIKGWESTTAYIPQSPYPVDEQTRGWFQPTQQEKYHKQQVDYYRPPELDYFLDAPHNQINQKYQNEYRSAMPYMPQTDRMYDNRLQAQAMPLREQMVQHQQQQQQQQQQVINSLEHIKIGRRPSGNSVTKENRQSNEYAGKQEVKIHKQLQQQPSYIFSKETIADVQPVKWTDLSANPRTAAVNVTPSPQKWTPTASPAAQKVSQETLKYLANNSPAAGKSIGPKMIRIKDFQFSLSDKIGEGSFSTVYLGHSLSRSHELVAVKIIDMAKQGSKFRDEIAICLKVNGHRNILRIYDHFIDLSDKKCYLFLEYCNQGSLQTVLNRISRVQAIAYFRQILEGMRELLRHNIIHRDIKLDNILLSNGEVKISDFGLSKQVFTDRLDVNSLKCGTPSTMAPEIFFAKTTYPSYNHKCDVWSLGVILHEMFYKIHPFDMNKEMLRQLQRVKVEQPCSIVEEFLKQSLVQNPKVRCSLEHIFTLDVYQQHLSVFDTSKKDQRSTGRSLAANTVTSIQSSPNRDQARREAAAAIATTAALNQKTVLMKSKHGLTYILLGVALALLFGAILASFPSLIQSTSFF